MSADTETVVCYSIAWPFFGGRQWHTVEIVDAFGWCVVSHYEWNDDHTARHGFAIMGSYRSRELALKELNTHLGWYSRTYADNCDLKIEETE
jgi:hypothetical protein